MCSSRFREVICLKHRTTHLGYGSREMGVLTSIRMVGDCVDDAVAESFFATLECEFIDWRSFQTLPEARMPIFEFIEGWHNTTRRRSRAGLSQPERLRAGRGANGSAPRG